MEGDVEESVAILRNQPRNKLEVLVIKGGWLVPEGVSTPAQDKYILRVWKLRGLDGDGSGSPSVHEIQLSAKEMIALVQAATSKLNVFSKQQLGG